VADGIPKNLKWSIYGIANMLERCRYRGVTELAVGITEAPNSSRAYGYILRHIRHNGTGSSS